MSRIVIDGNIGSGKTTQLDLLELCGWKVVREPIEKWPLKEFYEDPKRWGFFFYMNLIQTFKYEQQDENVIYERCLLTSRCVFLQLANLEKAEEDLVKEFCNDYTWMPDLFIYLKKDCKTAFESIQKRGQAGDSKITFEYLQKLDEVYDTFLESLPCKVLVINADKTPKEVHREISKYLLENELLPAHPLRIEV